MTGSKDIRCPQLVCDREASGDARIFVLSPDSKTQQNRCVVRTTTRNCMEAASAARSPE